jgi:hypothetical protein
MKQPSNVCPPEIQPRIQFQLHEEICLLGSNAVQSGFMLITCLVYSSTLKMEATCSLETSVDFQWTTPRYIPQGRTPHSHRCENLKSNFLVYQVLKASAWKFLLFWSLFYILLLNKFLNYNLKSKAKAMNNSVTLKYEVKGFTPVDCFSSEPRTFCNTAQQTQASKTFPAIEKALQIVSLF